MYQKVRIMWFLSKHTCNNINLHLKTIKLKKNYLFVSASSEEKLAVRTPITRPNNSTVHSSDFVGEGKETENWVWKKHTCTTHKAENAGILPVKKLCLSAMYIMQFSIQFPNADFCNRPRLGSWPLTRRLREYCYFSSREWVILTSCSLVTDDKCIPGT